MIKAAVGDKHAHSRFPGIFVVGCPRSGTSIVQRALANHPRATSFPETGYFRQLGSNRMWTRAAESGLVRPACATRAMKRLRRIMDDDGIDGAIMDSGTWRTRIAANFFARHVSRITASRGAAFWIEKTPKHYQTAEVIRRFLEHCIVVHVIRDGRDVLGSIRDRAMKYPERFSRELPPERGVDEWNKALRAAWRHHHEPRVFVVRYEDFVANPEQSLSRILEAIRESFDPAMLNPSSRDTISLDVESWKDGLNAPIAAPDSKYGRLFDEKEKAWIARNLDFPLFGRISNISV